MLEGEAAGGRPDDPPHLPGEAREREVAADELRRREVDRERGMDRAVQALPDREHEHRAGEHANATVAVVHAPAAQTARSDADQTTPISARPRMRRRPSASFATGSWKTTMPTASSAKITPTSRSLTWVTFFPNAGSSSIISEIAEAMNAAFSAVYVRNVRSRATARQLPPARSG